MTQRDLFDMSEDTIRYLESEGFWVGDAPDWLNMTDEERRQVEINVAQRKKKPPAQRHSATSVEAAQAIEPRAATLRRRVLDYLRECGDRGATRQEVEAALGMSGNTVRPRVCELMEMGLVQETTETRLTPSGRRAFVLVATTRENA